MIRCIWRTDAVKGMHNPFLQSTLRPRRRENIDFDLLKLLQLYFTILRWIDWDIEQHRTTTLKIPCFSSLALFYSQLWAPCGGEHIDFDLLKLLHLYFTILRWIDWDIEQHHTTNLKIPCFLYNEHFRRLRKCII